MQRIHSLRSIAIQAYLMPYTGLFLLRAVSGDLAPSTRHPSRAVRIRATCLSCGELLDAKELPDIEEIPGGVILYCKSCGSRQVITHHHLEVFLARTQEHGDV